MEEGGDDLSLSSVGGAGPEIRTFGNEMLDICNCEVWDIPQGPRNHRSVCDGRPPVQTVVRAEECLVQRFLFFFLLFFSNASSFMHAGTDPAGVTTYVGVPAEPGRGW